MSVEVFRIQNALLSQNNYTIKPIPKRENKSPAFRWESSIGLELCDEGGF